jgi:membrane associated rhomboid family serine protease
MTPVGPRCPDHATQGKPTLRAPVRQRASRRAAYFTTAEPVVTYGLIAVNVVIYLITVAQGSGINSPGGKLFFKWALFGPAVANGDWWRLITAAFLHGNVLHIGFNMLLLYWIGAPVERYLGHLRYLAVYIVSGLAGSAGALLVTPTSVTVGASGALFGIFGALFIIEYQTTGTIAGQASALIVINLLFSFTVSGISIGGHIGGLIGGIVATLAITELDRRRFRFGRPGLLGAMALLVVAALSIAISYWKVRGYA